MKYYLSIGSNDNAAPHLQAAIRLLAQATNILAVSSVYESPAAGESPAPPYLNAALIIESDVTADTLKEKCRAIEAQLGRVRPSDVVAIDIDIVGQAGGDLSPDVMKFAFVAVPLAEVAPEDIIDQATGTTLREIAERLSHQHITKTDIKLAP